MSCELLLHPTVNFHRYCECPDTSRDSKSPPVFQTHRLAHRESQRRRGEGRRDGGTEGEGGTEEGRERVKAVKAPCSTGIHVDGPLSRRDSRGPAALRDAARLRSRAAARLCCGTRTDGRGPRASAGAAAAAASDVRGPAGSSSAAGPRLSSAPCTSRFRHGGARARQRPSNFE